MYMRGQNTDPSMYIGTMISVGASAMIGAGWAIAHAVYNKKRYKKQEKERVDNYEKYIEETVKQLEDKAEESRKVLEANYPSSADFIYHTDADIIWNRNMYQRDFLTVRIGIGTREIPGGINIGSVKRAAAVNDELAGKPEELYDKYSYVEDCTATLSLIEHKIIGVVGEDNSQLINNLVVHCVQRILNK